MNPKVENGDLIPIPNLITQDFKTTEASYPPIFF
jgi:hypothetical protein